jgi:hypothetical protein
MTRRIAAAATLATVLGGIALAAVPAEATKDTRVCVTIPDSRSPEDTAVFHFCADEFLHHH